MRLRDKNLLRAAMAARHFTIRETALVSRCHPSMIGHLLSGHKTTCTPALAVRIEKALRTEPGFLFTPRTSTVKLSA
jgi:plasmid maintenance system antidote protein VapI